MTPEQIQELEPAFADYLLQFFPCCAYPQTFHLLEVYCRGLLSDLPRKSAEPIALASGTAVRTLQEFLKDHVWHYRLARDTLIEHVAGCEVAVEEQVPARVGDPVHVREGGVHADADAVARVVDVVDALGTELDLRVGRIGHAAHSRCASVSARECSAKNSSGRVWHGRTDNVAPLVVPQRGRLR